MKGYAKRFAALLLAAAVLCSLCACGGYVGGADVYKVSESGDALLTFMPQKVLEHIGIGETAKVRIGSKTLEMPFVDELIEEEGKLQLYYDKAEDVIKLCIYGGSFCDTHGVSKGDKIKVFKAD
jgi:S-adenosylmethionine hydrolase